MKNLDLSIGMIKDELADYDKQRQEAQQQVITWNQKALLAEGAFQACTALLKKLEIADAPSTPDP